jgi:hypothetical protein
VFLIFHEFLFLLLLLPSFLSLAELLFRGGQRSKIQMDILQFRFRYFLLLFLLLSFFNKFQILFFVSIVLLSFTSCRCEFSSRSGFFGFWKRKENILDLKVFDLFIFFKVKIGTGTQQIQVRKEKLINSLI